jgi:uncharacterized protein (DUF885 family)
MIPKEELEKIAEYAQHGVNKISFTISDAFNDVLRKIEKIENKNDVIFKEITTALQELQIYAAESKQDIKDVHERLDRLNGQVPKQGEKIIQLESFTKGSVWAGSVLIGIILVLIGVIWNNSVKTVEAIDAHVTKVETQLTNHIIK